jgi:hypothetical protein
MPDMYTKLCPDRDLQCYFERPSAIAALSETHSSGFVVSGTWRQQFDWAVLEWNRDNVFEHPLFRNLPDGDLSGIVLSYEEERTNCVAMDSDLYPTVDWPFLRMWTRENGADAFYRVRLKDYATPVAGSYVPASVELELQGSITPGDYVGVSFQTQHYTYQVIDGDTLETVVQQIVDSVNGLSGDLIASRVGRVIRLLYVGPGHSVESSTSGANGNRLGLYGFVSGAQTESWTPQWRRFSGGESPSRWRIDLDFSSLLDKDSNPVPTSSVRKLRWTYSADLQEGPYERSEFQVRVTSWMVTGSRLSYRVAGPGSRRIEDKDEVVQYIGEWSRGTGNFSGGSIMYSHNAGAAVRISYQCATSHKLYLGTRYAGSGCSIQVTIDGQSVTTESLSIPGEDVLVRIPLSECEAGQHEVEVVHAGPEGAFLFFDFLQIAHPTTILPSYTVDPTITLATDWDTDHSIAIAPERTAWNIHVLGFHGRANHYVGALWHYELGCDGQVYASATVDFNGTPEFSAITEIRIGRTDQLAENDAIIQHINRIGDTPDTIAKAFEIELNRGYTAIRAEAVGSRLTIYSRKMGQEGNTITLAVSPTSGAFVLSSSGATLTGGMDGQWRTDLDASPRLNRAVRDWCRSFYVAMLSYGVESAAAFSMELQHGDPSPEAGLAQRYPNGAAALLNTPALQTNFSPVSIAFWKEVYREMATIQQEAGQQPYLQFGEVQWWYFPSDGSGMPFYDSYTQERFQAAYGRQMAVITTHTAEPSLYQQETELLPLLIGEFTDAVVTHVRAAHPNCRFEVLYPTDVNDTEFNTLINYPGSAWTSSTLDCIKTESFTYTLQRNLDRALGTMRYGGLRGFSPASRSFLVGISDPTTAWQKEVSLAKAEGVESIVLFAIDQFCLIGYRLPLVLTEGHALYQG